MQSHTPVARTKVLLNCLAPTSPRMPKNRETPKIGISSEKSSKNAPRYQCSPSVRKPTNQTTVSTIQMVSTTTQARAYWKKRWQDQNVISSKLVFLKQSYCVADNEEWIWDSRTQELTSQQQQQKRFDFFLFDASVISTTMGAVSNSKAESSTWDTASVHASTTVGDARSEASMTSATANGVAMVDFLSGRSYSYLEMIVVSNFLMLRNKIRSWEIRLYSSYLEQMFPLLFGA